jgi:hypothetical protein
MCEECTRRYERGGMCDDCPDEPLLDLADEDVRLMIDEFDDRRFWKRSTIWTFLSLALVSPFGIAAWNYMGTKIGVAVWGLLTGGLSTFLIKRFPPEPKLPELTPEEIQRMK